mgnify:CR=1 FL=1
MVQDNTVIMPHQVAQAVVVHHVDPNGKVTQEVEHQDKVMEEHGLVQVGLSEEAVVEKVVQVQAQQVALKVLGL